VITAKILKKPEAKAKLRKWRVKIHPMTYSMSVQYILVKESMGMTNLSWTRSSCVRHGTWTRALFGEANKWINHLRVY